MISKKDQRKKCIENRISLSDDERRNFSKEICKKISNLSEYKNAKNILSYMASFDEADPSHLGDEDKIFSYPVSFENGIMKAYIPAKENGFEEGKFGILSPNPKTAIMISPQEIDLVIVPCVGFDENKGRLGHGKGYYDRYLPLCKNAKFICIAFEAQKLDKVVTDEYDVPMDFIVTEKEIYK